ncbi:amidohydrolase family protein [Derxia gummosa]|uniref:Amidohydrolase family protein n=1 Tax=Derxia gummosa DSM 723 TaxID=1121388 RepID=A0A8B6X2X9_9BURK|nr:amidohydrolase [Derxia gummosa]
MPNQLLHADLVLPMTPGNPVIRDGAVVVGDDGRILAVGPASDLLAAHPDAAVRRLPGRLLMPGLVNTHSHSGLLRGTAEGLPVWEWLRRFIDPMHRVLTPEDAEAASWLCYAESLLAGTTTVLDMWRHMDGSGRAAEALGLRAVLVPYAAEHPEHDYFETLASNAACLARWHGAAGGRISVWVGMEHLFYFTPDAWARAVALARDHGTGLHTHSNESRFDVEESLRRFGKRPLRAMEALGLLDAPRVLLAHGVWLDDDEIALLAERKVGIAHNPVSNMKLASGAAPVTKLLAAGVAVGLGSDGEKENNNLDLFEEMKVASLLAKLTALDAGALDAWDVLGMATIGGARALGLDADIGSLEAGKQADLIAVRTDTPRMTPLVTDGPLMNLHHNLVHAVRGGDVALTMVAGRVVAEDGVLLTADLPELIGRVNALAPALFTRRADWLAAHATVDSLRG